MTSFSYPGHVRLRKRQEYLRCYENGRKFHSAHFVFYVLWNLDEGTKTGIAVSRKVGNAVTRNRVKRILREFFRLNLHRLPGMWVVAVAKKNAGSLNLKELETELAPILGRLNNLNTP